MGINLLIAPFAIKNLAEKTLLSDMFEFILVKSPFLVIAVTMQPIKKKI
jgi:hypothetical protein